MKLKAEGLYYKLYLRAKDLKEIVLSKSVKYTAQLEKSLFLLLLYRIRVLTYGILLSIPLLALQYCQLNISAFTVGERKLCQARLILCHSNVKTLTEASVLLCAGSLCSRVLKLAFELETAIRLVTNVIFNVGM